MNAIRLFLVLNLLLVFAPAAFACDNCNLTLSLAPNARRHFIGLLYRYDVLGGYRNLPSATGLSDQPQPWGKTLHDPALHQTDPEASPDYNPNDYERYHVLELQGGFFVHPRLELQGRLALHRRSIQIADTRARNSSVGDLHLLAIGYPIWHQSTSRTHRLGLAGGVIFPTGQYAREKPAEESHLFAGRGSFGGLLGTNYTYRRRRWGALLDASWRINGTNPAGYRFTNVVNATGRAFLSYTLGKAGGLTLQPVVGLGFEGSGGEYNAAEWVPGTGGRVFAATAGVYLFAGPVGIQLEASRPVHQDLFGTQLGQGSRYALRIQCAIGKEKTQRTKPAATQNRSGSGR